MVDQVRLGSNFLKKQVPIKTCFKFTHVIKKLLVKTNSMNYGDLDHIPITSAQYKANLLYQYPHLDPTFSITELENLIDILQVPYDTRIAFCQATGSLPELVQRIIFPLIEPEYDPEPLDAL